MAQSEEFALSIVVNGRSEQVLTAPLRPLADVLRDDLDLTGTKLGCRAGDCGSCTVLLDGVPMTSCLIPAAHADGSEVVTVEGLERGGELHPVQAAFREHNASQCGYCIPGILMAAAGMYDTGTVATRREVVEGLSGNLCRCTGYESIVDAISQACGVDTQEDAT